ncbi:response regulator transcription factor [Sphingomonas sp. NSE70-1]|uniref:Response regulator transcription factor n=1 Tax=Sphingomonas caseinilyticus TaxID=2908205 RepID=A0ABT0RX70_9SPHN|nr:response regulator transcription factor [Sphingomonas caseinilyticus]MCL6699602.1 response regulator transcription factor [Sphingomonas caseinilyticus]
MKVLLIEDDRTLADYVAKGLRESGHVVDICRDGKAGLYSVAEQAHDVIVLDRMLPGVDGMTILQTMRAAANATPVMILTALGEVDDRVEGLRKGGDDYLSKPFSLQELIARVEALGRRPAAAKQVERLAAHGLEMDLLRRHVLVRGEEVRLTSREFQILEVLLRNAGRVVTRSMLLEAVWDYRFDPQTNIVDQHVSRLRQKLGDDGANEVIETVRGVGYRVKG